MTQRLTTSSSASSRSEADSDTLFIHNYRNYVHNNRDRSSDFQWLNLFLQDPRLPAVQPQTAMRLYCFDEAGQLRVEDHLSRCSSTEQMKATLQQGTNDLRAVIVCHASSCSVDRDIVDLLGSTLDIDVQFFRQHFDHKHFADEFGCPDGMADTIKREQDLVSKYWTMTARWNPVHLPSEASGRYLRLSLDQDCMSLCLKDNIAIILIRSARGSSVRPENPDPGSWHTDSLDQNTSLFPRYFAALNETETFSIDETPLQFAYPCIRLLLLDYWAEFVYLHDPQPLVDLSMRDHKEILALYPRYEQLSDLHTGLSNFLRCFHPKRSATVKKLRSLVRDAQCLLSQYNRAIKFVERHEQDINTDFQHGLIREQLAEARESKAAAISVGRLTKLAFIYIPLNFVCAMLGMNLSIFGAGTIPLWIFFLVSALVLMATTVPILRVISKSLRAETPNLRLACKLAMHSPSAGFWYGAFCITHSSEQIKILRYSGINWVLERGQKSVGPRRWVSSYEVQDDFYKRARLGSDAFWKGRVEYIYSFIDTVGWEDHYFPYYWRSRIRTRVTRDEAAEIP